MKNLIVKEKQEFMGVRIPVIEGGFGEGQKVILAKTIAEIHKTRLDKINDLIKNNLSRFNENELVDLKTESLNELANLLKVSGLYTQNSINASANIFLLSERGYTKLVSMMDNSNDKKWEVMDKLIDEYFTLRANKQNLDPEEIVIMQMQEQLKIKKQLNEVNHHALEAKSKVRKLEKDFIDYKENDTLSVAECEELSDLVKKIGVARLGGKDTKSYKNKAVRMSLFKNIWGEVKNQFGVNKYKQIKRKYFVKAKEIIMNYEPTVCLNEQIRACNNQIDFMKDFKIDEKKEEFNNNNSRSWGI